MDIPEILKGKPTQKTASGRDAKMQFCRQLCSETIDLLEDAERDSEGTLTQRGRLQSELILAKFMVTASAPSAESASD